MSDVRCHWNKSVTTGERQQAVMEVLLLARSMRDVRSVLNWVEDPDVVAASADANIGQKVAECRRWLVEASAFEANNRRESLLDRTHPFWIKKLGPARLRARQIVAGQRAAAS